MSIADKGFAAASSSWLAAALIAPAPTPASSDAVVMSRKVGSSEGLASVASKSVPRSAVDDAAPSPELTDPPPEDTTVMWLTERAPLAME